MIDSRGQCRGAIGQPAATPKGFNQWRVEDRPLVRTVTNQGGPSGGAALRLADRRSPRQWIRQRNYPSKRVAPVWVGFGRRGLIGAGPRPQGPAQRCAPAVVRSDGKVQL
eukprot:g30095.t1